MPCSARSELSFSLAAVSSARTTACKELIVRDNSGTVNVGWTTGMRRLGHALISGPLLAKLWDIRRQFFEMVGKNPTASALRLLNRVSHMANIRLKVNLAAVSSARTAAFKESAA